MRNEGVIAIDNGGHSTCVKTASAFGKFPSAKGEYRERSLVSTHGRHDYIIEYQGKKYMGGTLAVECEFPIQMHTDSKQHIFYDLSVLTAIHQYGFQRNFVVTSVPIFMHTEEEKSGIIKRLVGEHSIIINGVTKVFTIADVRVAPETVSPFWISEPQGKVRWVDWGSRTIGYGTTINNGETMRFLDSESGTFRGKGLEAIRSNDIESLVDYVGGRLSAIWGKDDKVFHVGGGAMNNEIVSLFKNRFFPNSVVHENPQLANAIGMYLLGRGVFERA